jgi:GMP synthase-like glutamine amidotransferase
MKIGILQTGLVPGEIGQSHGQYPSMFARLFEGHGLSFENFAVVEGVFPPDINHCAGWLITGSAAGVYEDHAWIAPLERFIRAAYSERIPLAGICFGHQIMAQALGGRAEKFSRGWGVGHHTYQMKDGGEIVLNAMHQDQVTICPPDAEVFAANDFCRFAGLAYRGNAISWQAHPEFTDAYLADLLEFRKGKSIPVPVAESAIATLGTGTQPGSLQVANQLAAFFRRAADQRAA